MEVSKVRSFNSVPVNPVRLQSHEEVQSDIGTGYEAWLRLIEDHFNQHNSKTYHLAVDGTHGAAFTTILEQLQTLCSQENIAYIELDSTRYMKSSAELLTAFDRYLTDNRAFGFIASDIDYKDYFRAQAQADWQNDVAKKLHPSLESLEGDGSRTIIITYGPGAGYLSSDASLSIFCDISRENQQRLHRQGMGSLQLGQCVDSVETYKQALFLEWPVWEQYRKRYLNDFDYYMDMNDPDQPTFLTLPLLRALMQAAAQQPIRVKPFFAPGIWGGQYLKKLCQLPEEWDNCAWSFEPIAPENTLLIEAYGHTLELPFPLLLSAHPEQIMGERNVQLFGDYFPIRFDYLDTIGGDNLSLQVHPRQSYIEEIFNERMTQQESYYIMEQEEGTTPFVALGFTEGTTGEQLLEAVDNAHASREPLEVGRYVNVLDAQKGDLFLIPPGAVHYAGRGNLVLEISSTTWWFTFKIYDHLRLDKDGLPRPINRDHASRNMNDSFSTPYVHKHLVPSPVITRVQGSSSEELLGEREDLLFQVKRLKLNGEWHGDTNGQFLMFNLVEGNRVRLTPLNNEETAVEWGYAESYIVPAAVGEFRIESIGDTTCSLIVAQVSPDWHTPLLPHHWQGGEA
ncbi:class I mannose-6-phosphate isomerase [Paenibacillus agri]|uniref:Class I mannose-6-phosphate isomerase n=1 Tax=Paenibacillus agri TaxID=2744309 RepID=A0A850ENE9_9BACL|nr:class I mannose-6-phosphate isomerase [Paenibacillus agri]NUU60112.1 class I mannose-6-phosphate isomerase [Paenibacillus agri]